MTLNAPYATLHDRYMILVGQLVFSCQHKVLAALYSQQLDRTPGDAFVYSDISMILLMYVVGHLARSHVSNTDLMSRCVNAVATSSRADEGLISSIDQCYYEAFVRKFVLQSLALPDRFIGFLPPRQEWAETAPTWNDTVAGFPGECVRPYRERVLQGEVSDGNSYAMGGIAGHAGLFAGAPELLTLLQQLVFAPALPDPGAVGVNATTVKTFTSVHNATQSSRALGWDTNAGSYRGCGNWSGATFTHTGYTGTMLCADKERGLVAVLLTNRVYPRADDSSEKAIHEVRQQFSNAVLSAVLPKRI